MLQRKAVTLCDDHEYISREDAAVHREDPEFEVKWELYLDGKGEPPLVAGAKPTVFKLRHIGTVASAKVASVRHSEGVLESILAAFALGVTGVENCHDKHGKALSPAFKVDGGVLPVSMLTPETVDAFDLDVVLEVGQRILARSNPSPK